VEFLSAKALTIAVGVAISLTITSGILFTLNQITLIYKNVYATDVSIKKEFAEFSMYDGTVMTGLEMYNTAKKFQDSKLVNIKCYAYGARNINQTVDGWIGNFDGSSEYYTSKLFNVHYSPNTVDNADGIRGTVTIKFTNKTL